MELDYTALGLDFHSIRNRNEERVLAMLEPAFEEFPGLAPRREDIEDVYALALNMLSKQDIVNYYHECCLV